MRVPEDSVNQGRFADICTRSRSSGSHSGSADGDGMIADAVVSSYGNCARRYLGAFAKEPSTGMQGIRIKVYIGMSTARKTASAEAPWFGGCTAAGEAFWRPESWPSVNNAIAATIRFSLALVLLSECGVLHAVIRLESACPETGKRKASYAVEMG